jgi:hypothetical protein
MIMIGALGEILSGGHNAGKMRILCFDLDLLHTLGTIHFMDIAA